MDTLSVCTHHLPSPAPNSAHGGETRGGGIADEATGVRVGIPRASGVVSSGITVSVGVGVVVGISEVVVVVGGCGSSASQSMGRIRVVGICIGVGVSVGVSTNIGWGASRSRLSVVCMRP
jgi:hypothetical protein